MNGDVHLDVAPGQEAVRREDVARPLDGHGQDRGFQVEREDEAALRERHQLTALAAGPFRRDPDVRPALELLLRRGEARDGALTVAVVDLDHARRPERPAEEGHREELGLGHHAHPSTEHVIEDWHVVVRLMIAHHDVRAADRALRVGTAERRLGPREVLAPAHADHDLRVPHDVRREALETLVAIPLRQPAAGRIEDGRGRDGERLVGIP